MPEPAESQVLEQEQSQQVAPSPSPKEDSPDLEEQVSSLQISDDLKNLLETVGEENIMGALQGYAQYAQEQEEAQKRQAQEEWEKAQAEQPNNDAQVIDDIYQKIVKDTLRKAKPHTQEAADQMMRDAYSQATAIFYRNVAKEEANRAIGQYVEHTSQSEYEKQQIYAQRPDLVEFAEYINDLVDRQRFPAKAVISRLDETIGFMKKIGRYSDTAPTAPTVPQNNPVYQSVHQMGPVTGRGGHLSVVPDDPNDMKQFMKAAKAEQDEYFGT